MPIFEYRCDDCSKKFEILHKSSVSAEDIMCPECGSVHNKKLFSAFSPKAGSSSSSDFGGCADGACNPGGGHQHSGGCCGGGMCGMN